MKNKSLSDKDLARRAKQGDISAFEEIYDRHATGIARALASFAGPDRSVLDDLTQEVFFRAIDGIGSYQPTHPFFHWLYTIALNVGRNHVRQRSKIVVLDPNEFDRIPLDDHSVRDESAELMEETAIRLVSGLPDHLREVVSLRIGSGMPYGDIAEVLGIPEGTARSRMFNAVKILKGELGGSHKKRERK
ncbi:MAG: RNA polymerase sigma factor [Candidatus Latescibacterota bacterium]|nr:MAG: RNA polymerase sigma factor [Candidatus Latescibacterota bacterium]